MLSSTIGIGEPALEPDDRLEERRAEARERTSRDQMSRAPSSRAYQSTALVLKTSGDVAQRLGAAGEDEVGVPSRMYW